MRNRACYICRYYKPTMVGNSFKNICTQLKITGNTRVDDMPSVCPDYKDDDRMLTLVGANALMRRLAKYKMQ